MLPVVVLAHPGACAQAVVPVFCVSRGRQVAVDLGLQVTHRGAQGWSPRRVGSGPFSSVGDAVATHTLVLGCKQCGKPVPPLKSGVSPPQGSFASLPGLTLFFPGDHGAAPPPKPHNHLLSWYQAGTPFFLRAEYPGPRPGFFQLEPRPLVARLGIAPSASRDLACPFGSGLRLHSDF